MSECDVIPVTKIKVNRVIGHEITVPLAIKPINCFVSKLSRVLDQVHSSRALSAVVAYSL